MLSERGTYGAAFELELANGAGHPAMIHEMGGSTAQYSPGRVALYDRLQMYSGLAAGSIGVDLWCYTDASPEQYHKAPYLRTPQETRWGMTTWDRQDKPLATEFRNFSKIVGQLDLPVYRQLPRSCHPYPGEWARTHGDFRASVSPVPRSRLIFLLSTATPFPGRLRPVPARTTNG